jgi:hypothetical protein
LDNSTTAGDIKKKNGFQKSFSLSKPKNQGSTKSVHSSKSLAGKRFSDPPFCFLDIPGFMQTPFNCPKKKEKKQFSTRKW